MTTSAQVRATRNPGLIASIGVAIVLLAFAFSVDLPKPPYGFKGDESTYYSLAHSLARDFDFAFERKDLVRVWEEFSGPEGIFLKRGKTIQIRRSIYFPFVRWVKHEDPVQTRLYYGKSFIFPLAAAPFVFAFGTHGFYVLHALLLSLDLFVAYTFLAARGSPPRAALTYATVFLFASVVPVYGIWLTPELFNFSLALYALFLWSYKETAVECAAAGARRFLCGVRSDYAAAALIGVLTFSKPTHALLLFPVVALAAGRRQWRRAFGVVVAWGVLTGGLFGANAAITGEFNYQGGDRRTFYSRIGFPFANDRETFDNIAQVRGREGVMVGDVLLNKHTLTVFRHNLVYDVFGRSGGLVPYFFPGVLSAVLFLFTKPRRRWQWLAGATLVGGIVAMLLVWPFTYSGGGGPVGNRYFLSFYPLFLLLTPPLAGIGAAGVGLTVGALCTAKILLNPFYASFYPGEHMKYGPLRWLPLELTLLNDLPVAAVTERMKQELGGTPPVLAYFPDDNAWPPEGDRGFWVKGKSRTEVILRAPVADMGQNQFVTKTITRLAIEIENGGEPDRVTVSTGRESRTFDMKPAEKVQFTLAVSTGVPYRRDEQPTSYVYVLSIATTSGFVPFLMAGSDDSRFLGARIHVVPEYADGETVTWVPPGS